MPCTCECIGMGQLKKRIYRVEMRVHKAWQDGSGMISSSRACVNVSAVSRRQAIEIARLEQSRLHDVKVSKIKLIKAALFKRPKFDNYIFVE